MLNMNLLQILLILLVSLGTGGVIVLVAALAFPRVLSSGVETRVQTIIGESKAAEARKQSALSRLVDGQRDNRRKQVQESLKQVEERARKQKRSASIRLLILRAGLDIPVRRFWFISAGVGVVTMLLALVLGLPLYGALLAGVVGCLGLPRWFLAALAKRRQKAFLDGLADAVDVMVRGLKSGLPMSDAMRMIASEAAAPIGPEFGQLVEGQRLGIPFEQGFERMYERMPLSEISFLGIVINIQSKTGGNLSEALGNLSRLLRERKKLEGKVKSMSQEAKSSAAIIGSLPFFIIGALFMLNPTYLNPLINTTSGHIILVCAGLWMVCGLFVMRKMINFEL